MPRVLLNRLGQPRPGLRRLQLLGLDPRDAEQMLREAGITGNSERMQQYMERQFGCHPLIVGVVGGLIRNNLRARGSCDRWLNDPDGGGSLNLASPDIIQRRTHILKLAFDGLDPMARDLLSRIAMIANAADLDVLEALNPARPPPPKEVEAAKAPNFERDFWLLDLSDDHAAAKTPEQRADIAHQIADRLGKLEDEYETARQAYTAYQAGLCTWRGSDALRAASRKLNKTLVDLETRGLVQCDRHGGKFDLHPVVRGYAVGSLSAEARAQTGQQVADYFLSRAKPSYKTATSLEELANSIQVVQALNLAGKTQAAWAVLNSDLRGALLRLERHYKRLELIQPLFSDGWSAPPVGVDDKGLVAHLATSALLEIGLSEAAAIQSIFSIRESIKGGVNSNLSLRLQNHSATVQQNYESARSERILNLARDVSMAGLLADRLLWCDLFVISRLTDLHLCASVVPKYTTAQPSHYNKTIEPQMHTDSHR